MGSYIRDRLLQAVVTFWLILTMSFFMIRLMPGGPVEWMIEEIYDNPEYYGLEDPPAHENVMEVVEFYVSVPVDKPLHVQYIDWLQQVLLKFDLGNSLVVARGRPVFELVINAAPWTIFISVLALISGLIMGIIFGATMAYYEGSKYDIGMTVTTILTGAIPYFVMAIFLLFLFGFQWGLFPTGGHYNQDYDPGLKPQWILSVFYHAALPAGAFIITGFGGALGLRANSIRLLGSEHVRNAKLRGLSSYRISMAYLARNAILPMWTGIVIGLGGIIGGSVLMEEIFQYPGMGLLMLDAALARDFPLLMGVFLITTTMFIIGTLIADFTYPLIDPRADMLAERR